MTFDRLTVLLPCHSLEDLSLERSAEESEELLSAWSALYHPALLLHARALPRWVQADTPPDDPAACLTVIPRPAESLLPAGWLDQALAGGAAVVRNQTDREAMVADALARLPGESPRFDPGLVGDFLALGFCHFQVELLTRRLRYMSNLDESRFQERTLAAAQEAADGRDETAREQLHSAFDLLTEAREYFYPVETYLLDLTLVAPTTIGPSLRAELARGGPLNLLLSGETVQRMAEREPQTLAALREGLEKEQVTIIGGEYDERELPLLTHEAILDHVGRGLDVYQRAPRPPAGDFWTAAVRAHAAVARRSSPPGFSRLLALHARRRPVPHRKPEPDPLGGPGRGGDRGPGPTPLGRLEGGELPAIAGETGPGHGCRPRRQRGLRTLARAGKPLVPRLAADGPILAGAGPFCLGGRLFAPHGVRRPVDPL